MSTKDAVTTPDVLGWSVTCLLFLGTMAWNWLNRCHTNRVAAEIRRDQFLLDQWARYRSRVEDRLDTLMVVVDQGQTEVRALHKNKSATQTLEVLSHKIASAHDGMTRVLEELDRTHFGQFDMWAQTAFGVQHGTESSWDRLLSQLEIATAAPTKGETVKELQEAHRFAVEIEQTVRARIRLTDDGLRPEPD